MRQERLLVGNTENQKTVERQLYKAPKEKYCQTKAVHSLKTPLKNEVIVHFTQKSTSDLKNDKLNFEIKGFLVC